MFTWVRESVMRSWWNRSISEVYNTLILRYWMDLSVDHFPVIQFSGFNIYPLGTDKVSILAHTYPHKPLKKIKMTICNHQADSPLHVWPDVWSGDLQVYKMCSHTWHRMSLLRPGVVKQHKSKLFTIYALLTNRSLHWAIFTLGMWECCRVFESMEEPNLLIFHLLEGAEWNGCASYWCVTWSIFVAPRPHYFCMYFTHEPSYRITVNTGSILGYMCLLMVGYVAPLCLM